MSTIFGLTMIAHGAGQLNNYAPMRRDGGSLLFFQNDVAISVDTQTGHVRGLVRREGEEFFYSKQIKGVHLSSQMSRTKEPVQQSVCEELAVQLQGSEEQLLAKGWQQQIRFGYDAENQLRNLFGSRKSEEVDVSLDLNLTLEMPQLVVA